jgi:hypothetical protein
MLAYERYVVLVQIPICVSAIRIGVICDLVDVFLALLKIKLSPPI